MRILFISQVGNPNLLEIYGLLFGVLTALWLLNVVNRWLRQKPWHRRPLENATQNVLTDHGASRDAASSSELRSRIVF